MAIIVEDGSGLADAESYISVIDASAYHLKRGNTAWTDIDDVEIYEQLLIKATDYMIAQYRLRWAGYRSVTGQALDFPRAFVPLVDTYFSQPYLDSNIVPIQVKNACAELALKALTVELMPDLEQSVIREKVDVIEVEYDRFSPQQKRFSQIDAMLMPFFISNGMTAKLVRT
jgi:hypothetical protein